MHREFVVTKNGNTKLVRIQVAYAPKAGTSSIGTKYKKGDPILHICSNRSTGEVVTFTEADDQMLSILQMEEGCGTWISPEVWPKDLTKKAKKLNQDRCDATEAERISRLLKNKKI